VRIDLDRKYLCTEAARNSALMAWADQRSREGFVPELIWQEWALKMGNNNDGTQMNADKRR
jgi:hypothetical protein